MFSCFRSQIRVCGYRRHEYGFNTPLAGGRAYNASFLENFLDNFKTSADINAKQAVSYTASISHIHTQSERNPPKGFWENGVLVTSCHTILGRKTADIQWLLECRVLKRNTGKKRYPKMPNTAFYKMAISDYPYFLFLTPKNQIFDFLKTNPYKIKRFEHIQETGTYM